MTPAADRLIEPKTALYLLSMVHSGVITMETAMRLVWPDLASAIYNPCRWPWGAPND